MIYAMVPAIVLIINLIINWELLTKYGFRLDKHDMKKRIHVYNNYFIISACAILL